VNLQAQIHNIGGSVGSLSPVRRVHFVKPGHSAIGIIGMLPLNAELGRLGMGVLGRIPPVIFVREVVSNIELILGIALENPL
jgi:hypothetical protein